MTKYNVKSSKRIPDTVYINYVLAKVSYLLGQQWHPSRIDSGYIERCWIDGKDADTIAEALASTIKEMDKI